MYADADNNGHCGGTACGGLYLNVMQQAVYFATLKSAYLGNKSGILAVGINGSPALTQFQSWITAGNIKEPVTHITNTTLLQTVNFSQYKVLYIPSALVNNGGVTVNGINDAQNNVLASRKADIANYVNNLGGSLIALGQSRLVKAYQWLPVPLQFQALDITTVSVTPGKDSPLCCLAFSLIHSV